MKLVIFIFALLASLLILNNQAWSATPVLGAAAPHNKPLLREIRNITKRCVSVSAPLAGQAPQYRSQCAVLSVDSFDTAHIFVEGQWLQVQIVPSEDADGDDLAILVITDEKGRVIAQKNNVLAFGNVLFAMAGENLDLN